MLNLKLVKKNTFIFHKIFWIMFDRRPNYQWTNRRYMLTNIHCQFHACWYHCDLMNQDPVSISDKTSYCKISLSIRGWVGLWGFLWWAPSARGKDHHGVSSGWSSVWHRSNTGISCTQYEQIPIILGVWPFWLTPFFFWSITFWRANG